MLWENNASGPDRVPGDRRGKKPTYNRRLCVASSGARRFVAPRSPFIRTESPTRKKRDRFHSRARVPLAWNPANEKNLLQFFEFALFLVERMTPFARKARQRDARSRYVNIDAAFLTPRREPVGKATRRERSRAAAPNDKDLAFLGE
jgi:hypothetical protein